MLRTHAPTLAHPRPVERARHVAGRFGADLEDAYRTGLVPLADLTDAVARCGGCGPRPVCAAVALPEAQDLPRCPNVALFAAVATL